MCSYRLSSIGLLALSLSSITVRADDTGATDEAVRQWQEMRFGMFIHWGPVSLKGTEIGWSRGREVPAAEYDMLYQKFNPTAFDAFPCVAIDRALVKIAIELSERYQISYWDGAIIAATEALDAVTLFSEDLNHGQLYGSVRVVNPFQPG